MYSLSLEHRHGKIPHKRVLPDPYLREIKIFGKILACVQLKQVNYLTHSGQVSNLRMNSLSLSEAYKTELVQTEAIC